MTPFPFQLVGFDLDGTLLDTSGDLGTALNHALALVGRPAIPLDQTARHIGGGTASMLRSALAATGGALPEVETLALQDQLVAFYEANIAAHSKPYPGTLAMLDDLATRGVRLAVATNKREHLAIRLFTELGLIDRFACVIGGDTLGLDRAKPKRDMIDEMIARSGGASRTAFVGDTTYDIGAARAAQVPVVAVSFGFNDRPPADLGADAVIDHYDELVPTLTRLAT